MNMEQEQITDLLPRIEFIARSIYYKRPHIFEFQDLVQEGVLALLKAATRFDPDRGARLWTYAEFSVRGAMLDMFRSHQAKQARIPGTDLMAEPVFLDTAHDPEDPTPPAAEARVAVREFTDLISARERDVIRRRFWAEESMAEIARDYHVHASRPSQLCRRAMAKMQMAAAA